MHPIADKFHHTRNYTTKICKPLTVEDCCAQPAEMVSPPKWSMGHTTWFFETFVMAAFDPSYELYNKEFPYFFNSYYNNAGDRVLRHKRGDMTRPTLEEVLQYRAHVDAAIKKFISRGIDKKVADVIELGIQHEQQHQELLWTDLKYTLSLNPFGPAYEGELPFSEMDEKPETGFVKIKEGVYEIGFEGEGFCYDNEKERHKVYINDFEIADRLVTNAEMIDFINDGGYQNFNLWHDEGWKWVNENNICSPLYWKKIEGSWMNYTLKGLKKVRPEEALKHISYYESFAIAEWKGLRLPTESEWEIASGQFEWGKRWEWTRSAYLPYPGYQKADGAIGEYNGKFMVNQMVLRGASVATTKGHSRNTYRNFFHPFERWQYTGLRLAK